MGAPAAQSGEVWPELLALSKGKIDSIGEARELGSYARRLPPKLT